MQVNEVFNEQVFLPLLLHRRLISIPRKQKKPGEREQARKVEGILCVASAEVSPHRETLSPKKALKVSLAPRTSLSIDAHGLRPSANKW